MASFERAIGNVLELEKGYSNDPADRGGETKFGISKRSYPHLNIRDLTRQDAEDILHIDYWDRLWCDMVVGQKIAALMFDFAVTSGVRVSTKAVQSLVNVKIDGFIGPVTLAAINSTDQEILALRFTLERIRYYSAVAAGRASQRKFLAGWINRALAALDKA